MDRISDLFARYKNNSCTAEEIEELLEYFKADRNELQFKELIGHQLAEQVGQQDDLEIATEEVYGNLKIHLQQDETPVRKSFAYRWLAAASVIALLGFTGYLITQNSHPQLVTRVIKPQNTIISGSNKAILTLSNGKQIVLTGAANGVLASQGKTKIVKKANGEISYDAQNATDGSDAVAYNTIAVPRGGQYQVVLPDGTSVMLNAASSLTYPITFTGKTRNVELKGEAYFEVEKNKEMPFVVKANGVDVRVLGTHFDISAYEDDASVATTLLEGSVRLSKGNNTVMLTPGQQGVALNNQTDIAVKTADVDQVIAWTTGDFIFNDLNIKEVMKIVGRWYDIDVAYQGNVQGKRFGGKTSRYKNITELLDYMKITGNINYKIDGRRVTLMN